MFWGLFKKTTFLILFLILFIFSLFAKDSAGHNEDIGYIIYGFSEYDNFFSKASKDELMSYWIVSDATAFAIDEQGMGKTKEKYDALQNNIKTTRKGKTLILPPYSDFPSTGGGNHRAYNHLGFYWDYRDREVEQDGKTKNPYLDRWIMGRDKILIPSVAVAFDLNIDAPEAEAIAVIAYYCHMLGDEYQGKTSQMTTMPSFYFMLSQLKTDLMIALKKTGRITFFYNEPIMNDKFKKIQYSVRSCKSKETAFFRSREFMRIEMPIIIEKLIGKKISDIVLN